MLEIVHLGLVRLGHGTDKKGHILAKTVIDVLDGVGSVLNYIMKQGSADD